jgi:RecB family endonuclease NucS
MPVKQSIWRIGKKPTALIHSKLKNEEILEDMIEKDTSILEDEWLIIGRQVVTKHKKEIDLLAIAPDGSLVVIELKKNKTPRDVVAQAIDYATWVEGLKADEISSIFESYSQGQNLKDAFKERFHVELEEENLNQSHQMVIVASELDDATERIIKYIAERGIAINAVFFEVF